MIRILLVTIITTMISAMLLMTTACTVVMSPANKPVNFTDYKVDRTVYFSFKNAIHPCNKSKVLATLTASLQGNGVTVVDSPDLASVVLELTSSCSVWSSEPWTDITTLGAFFSVTLLPIIGEGVFILEAVVFEQGEQVQQYKETVTATAIAHALSPPFGSHYQEVADDNAYARAAANRLAQRLYDDYYLKPQAQ